MTKLLQNVVTASNTNSIYVSGVIFRTLKYGCTRK